jgi:hypothetical protein
MRIRDIGVVWFTLKKLFRLVDAVPNDPETAAAISYAGFETKWLLRMA